MSDVQARPVYVTSAGLPLFIDLKWPFHKSGSGADFWVLHGDVKLGNSDGLHAPVAVNLSVTVSEVLPSLEAKDTEAPVINSLRKEVDRRQLGFQAQQMGVRQSDRRADIVAAGAKSFLADSPRWWQCLGRRSHRSPIR